MPSAALAPTVWIGLGPVGVWALVALGLARADQTLFGDSGPTIAFASLLFATAVWGFGLWWLAIAVALRYVALVGFWCVVAVRNAAATRTGKIWLR